MAKMIVHRIIDGINKRHNSLTKPTPEAQPTRDWQPPRVPLENALLPRVSVDTFSSKASLWTYLAFNKKNLVQRSPGTSAFFVKMIKGWLTPCFNIL